MYNKKRLQDLHERELKSASCGMKLPKNLSDEKQRLLEEAFPDWTYEDFRAMCVGIFTFGWGEAKKIYETMLAPKVGDRISLKEAERYHKKLDSLVVRYGGGKRGPLAWGDVFKHHDELGKKLGTKAHTYKKNHWKDVDKVIQAFVKKHQPHAKDKMPLKFVHRSGHHCFHDRWLYAHIFLIMRKQKKIKFKSNQIKF